MARSEKRLPVRRWLTFVTGLMECVLFPGAVYGWASLVFVVKEEGYMNWMCVNITDVNGMQVVDCMEQDEKLSLVFTIASFADMFLTFSSGFVLDKFGTAVSRLYGITLYTTGTLMIAFSTPALSVLLYPALAFIAVGGSMLFISNMQVGNLFHSRRSTVVTLYSGAYGSSAALFLIIKLLYEAGTSLYASFLFVSACSVIHLLRTLFLMPRTLIPTSVPEHYTYGITCGELNRAGVGQTEVTGNRDDPVNGEKTFCECLLSRFYVLHVLWLSVLVLRHVLFIGTLNPVLQRMAGEEHSLVSHYTNAFALMQLGALVFGPWNGLIMDRHKGRPRSAGETKHEADLRATVLSLVLTSLQCVLFSVCASIPILPLQYLTFILQVFNYSFGFGGHAAFINIAFPLCHFGKLFGLALALAGLFSLLQYPCFILVEDVFDGDPLYVNIALTLLILFSFIHPISIYLHCRSLASQRANGNNTVALLDTEGRPIRSSVNPSPLGLDAGGRVLERFGLQGHNDK